MSDTPTLPCLQDEVVRWAETLWPESDLADKALKLAEEAIELAQAARDEVRHPEKVLHEFADVLICLTHVAWMVGFGPGSEERILTLMRDTFDERRAREKGKE